MSPPTALVRCRLPALLLTAALIALAAPTASAAEAPSVEEGFEGAGWYSDWRGWRPGPLNRAAQDTGLEGQGLSVTIPPGSHYGTRFAYAFSDPQPESLYFRYYLRFDDNFGQEGTGKLPGPVGIYNGTGLGGDPSTPDRPGWSARMQFAPGPRPGTTLLGYYAYHLDQSGLFGEGMSWGPVGVLDHGRWYCVEGAIDLNTPGETDGRLRGWVNGVPAMERNGLSFRRAAESDIRISSFWFNVYFGGPRPAQNAKKLTFDNVALGPERLGCGGRVPVALADVTGDGQDDAVELVACPEGQCWSVEAGNPLAFAPAVLAPSGARPGVETIQRGIAAGYFDSDRFADVVYLGACPDRGNCWMVHPGNGSGPAPAENWGAGPEQSTRMALLAGDVNGDGLDDLVSRGTCEGSPCWLVQYSTGEGFTAPTPAGDGAYFSDATANLGVVMADVDGDGRDDLVYRGWCGNQRPCWRVQLSTGDGFAGGASWGNTTGFAPITEALGFQAGDLNGDGRDDLLYRGTCGGEECWRALLASADGVFIARYWGSEASLGRASEGGGFRTVDVDGNGLTDVVYRATCDGGLCWQVSLSTGTGFISAGTEPIVDLDEPRPAFLSPERLPVRQHVLS